jgi:hypothetical protein
LVAVFAFLVSLALFAFLASLASLALRALRYAHSCLLLIALLALACSCLPCLLLLALDCSCLLLLALLALDCSCLLLLALSLAFLYSYVYLAYLARLFPFSLIAALPENVACCLPIPCRPFLCFGFPCLAWSAWLAFVLDPLIHHLLLQACVAPCPRPASLWWVPSWIWTITI